MPLDGAQSELALSPGLVPERLGDLAPGGNDSLVVGVDVVDLQVGELCMIPVLRCGDGAWTCSAMIMQAVSQGN